MLYHLTPTDRLRYESWISRTADCWLFTSAQRRGQATFSVGGHSILAHRLAWQLATGEDPGDLFVCHTCDVRHCVRNDDDGTYTVNGVEYRRVGHLFLADAAVNLADMAQKGRSLAGDRNPSRTRPECLARGDAHPARIHPERWARGEHAGGSILTEADVLAIRAEYQPGRGIWKRLARKYGVSDVMVRNIVLRKNWQHL